MSSLERRARITFMYMVSSEDVMHFDRQGGHIGLMAGSTARKEIWPDIAEWLSQRSDR